MDNNFLKYAKANNIPVNDKFYACWCHGYGVGMLKYIHEILRWAKKRKLEETAHRPDTNIHKKTLIETWNQVIKKVGGSNHIETTYKEKPND